MNICVRCCSPADPVTRLCETCKEQLLSMVGVSSEIISDADDKDENKEDKLI